MSAILLAISRSTEETNEPKDVYLTNPEKFSNALRRTLYYSEGRTLFEQFDSVDFFIPFQHLLSHRFEFWLVLANEIHQFNSRMNFLRGDSSGVIKAGNYREHAIRKFNSSLSTAVSSRTVNYRPFGIIGLLERYKL